LVIRIKFLLRKLIFKENEDEFFHFLHSYFSRNSWQNLIYGEKEK